jgi:radical SAM protein with 4Fe4S-binding SPASM domain
MSKTAFLLPTGRCNLKCKGCYATLEEFGRHSARFELELPHYAKIVSGLHSMGFRVFDISGGEPVLYRNLPSLLSHIKSLEGAQIKLVSNGSLKNHFERLLPSLAYVDEVYISIDGANARMHDVMRGEVGSFERVVETFRSIRQEAQQLWAGLNFLMYRSNIGEVLEVLRLAQHLDACRVQLLTLRDVSEYGSLTSELPTWVHYRDCIDMVYDYLADCGGKLEVEMVLPGFLLPDVTHLINARQDKNRIRFSFTNLRSDKSFVETVVIKPFGSITGQTAMVNFSVFDVPVKARDSNEAPDFEYVFDEAQRNWRNKAQARKEHLAAVGPCSDCSRWNYCRGGCPAAAFAQSGTILAHDKTCDNYRQELGW